MSDIHSKLDLLLQTGKPEKAEAALFDTAESLIKDASARLDLKDYHGAVKLYRQIIDLIRSYYGNSAELEDFYQSINELDTMC